VLAGEYFGRGSAFTACGKSSDIAAIGKGLTSQLAKKWEYRAREGHDFQPFRKSPKINAPSSRWGFALARPDSSRNLFSRAAQSQ
jgi:hypothetical protein